MDKSRFMFYLIRGRSPSVRKKVDHLSIYLIYLGDSDFIDGDFEVIHRLDKKESYSKIVDIRDAFPFSEDGLNSIMLEVSKSQLKSLKSSSKKAYHVAVGLLKNKRLLDIESQSYSTGNPFLRFNVSGLINQVRLEVFGQRVTEDYDVF